MKNHYIVCILIKINYKVGVLKINFMEKNLFVY